MGRMTRVYAFLLFLVMARVAAGQLTETHDTDGVGSGRAFFEKNCGFCHAPDATGGRGPDLVRSPLVAHDVNGDLIANLIRQGRPEKGMPALALSGHEIEGIVAFLHARAKEAIESSGIPTEYPLKRLLTGNAEQGRNFFNGAGGCAKCHSATGDLAGISGRYSAIELEAHALYPDEKPILATVTLPSGGYLSGVVAHIDDFIIAIRVGDRNGWYRSFPRDEVTVTLKDPLSAHRELLPKLTQEQMHDLFAYLYSLK